MPSEAILVNSLGESTNAGRQQAMFLAGSEPLILFDFNSSGPGTLQIFALAHLPTQLGICLVVPTSAQG